MHIDATEPDPGIGGRSTGPLTPRNAAGMVALWEEHDRGRIGIEAYYTGEQDLEGNPYRTKSQRNVELGMLGELTLGNASVFLNLKNILDVRQPQGFTAPPNARA